MSQSSMMAEGEKYIAVREGAETRLVVPNIMGAEQIKELYLFIVSNFPDLIRDFVSHEKLTPTKAATMIAVWENSGSKQDVITKATNEIIIRWGMQRRGQGSTHYCDSNWLAQRNMIRIEGPRGDLTYWRP